MGQVGRLLQEIWRAEGYVFLPHRQDGKWHEQDHGYAWPRPLDTIVVNRKADVYFCPLVFNKRQRVKANALPTHVLWADLDSASPYTCRLRPSVAWQTTTPSKEGDPPAHWQALWFVANEFYWLTNLSPTERIYLSMIPAVEAAALSKRIAYAEPGADKGGWDVTQVLRLPGTLNHKHTPPQEIPLLWAERRYYTVEQVEAAYPPVPANGSSHISRNEAGNGTGEHGGYAATGSNTGTEGWTDLDPLDVDDALAALPYGLQVALDRDPAGADRSLELLKLARTLLHLRPPVPVPMVLHLLAGSAMARSKYAGRSDMKRQLVTLLEEIE